MKLTTAQIETITNALDADAALQISGELGDTYTIREAYIRAILGQRATGGFFQPTVANIKLKFIDAWKTANDAR